MKVLRKPNEQDVVIAAHAKRENHYASFAHLKISQVFIQKISITLLQYVWETGCLSLMAKV